MIDTFRRQEIDIVLWELSKHTDICGLAGENTRKKRFNIFLSALIGKGEACSRLVALTRKVFIADPAWQRWASFLAETKKKTIQNGLVTIQGRMDKLESVWTSEHAYQQNEKIFISSD